MEKAVDAACCPQWSAMKRQTDVWRPSCQCTSMQILLPPGPANPLHQSAPCLRLSHSPLIQNNKGKSINIAAANFCKTSLSTACCLLIMSVQKSPALPAPGSAVKLWRRRKENMSSLQGAGARWGTGRYRCWVQSPVLCLHPRRACTQSGQDGGGGQSHGRPDPRIQGGLQQVRSHRQKRFAGWRTRVKTFCFSCHLFCQITNS